MFRGRYQHTIDPKGRLSVPARFRDALAQYDGALVVVPNDHCLEVHPLEEWQRIETKLREQSIFNPEVRELGRLYISRAKDVALDAAGRALIPPDAREHAGASSAWTWTPRRSRGRARVWRRSAIASGSRARASATSRRPPARTGSTAPARFSWTWACPPGSSSSRDEDSPSRETSPSTCVWIPGPARRRPRS